MSMYGSKSAAVIRIAVILLLGLALHPLESMGELIVLQGEPGQSTRAAYATSQQALLMVTNDDFAYNPDKPADPRPRQRWNEGIGFHGNNANTTLAFQFGHSFARLFVDFYGREDCCWERDDRFTVEFYRGGWEQEHLQERVESGIPGRNAPFHARVTAKANTYADRLKVIGGGNQFTLMEIRANGVKADGSGNLPPRPKLVLLSGIGSFTLGEVKYPDGGAFSIGGSDFNVVVDPGRKPPLFNIRSETSGKTYGPFPYRPGQPVIVGGLRCRLQE